MSGSTKVFGQNEVLNAGSIIIDMGSTSPTAANSLKPYGLVYDLLKNYYVPVKRIINSAKLKDGIDFTHNGKTFKGGPFIIPVEFRSALVNKAISNWKAQGVLIDSLVSSQSLPVAFTLTTAPRWALDAQYGSVAVTFMNAAGIPASAYSFNSPNNLNTCDDIYIMPHADPTWNTHRNLYFWNKNQKGAIWAGCHAPSVLEGLYKDTTSGLGSPNSGSTTRITMNFLTTNGLLLYSAHTGPTLPLVHLLPGDPNAQFMGLTDNAQIKGVRTEFIIVKIQ